MNQPLNQPLISNQQVISMTAIRSRRNAEYRIAIRRFQFDSTEMHKIAITRPQFDKTEMHEVHTNRTRTATANNRTHFDDTYEYGSDDTTNLPNLRRASPRPRPKDP